MKRSILLVVGACASLLAYNAYSLTCGAQPSCDTLGYKYTGSTSDCINTPMKCPFNTSYFNCTKKADALSQLKNDIVTAAMPDYSKIEVRSCNVTYTAASNGYLIGSERFWDNWSNCSGSGFTVTINNKNVRLSDVITGDYVNTWVFPVKKGASYHIVCGKCSGSFGEYKYSFVPLS